MNLQLRHLPMLLSSISSLQTREHAISRLCFKRRMSHSRQKNDTDTNNPRSSYIKLCVPPLCFVFANCLPCPWLSTSLSFVSSFILPPFCGSQMEQCFASGERDIPANQKHVCKYLKHPLIRFWSTLALDWRDKSTALFSSFLIQCAHNKLSPKQLWKASSDKE